MLQILSKATLILCPLGRGSNKKLNTLANHMRPINIVGVIEIDLDITCFPSEEIQA